MDNRPIGVFDSGLGGLTAVKELEKLLPGESIVYFGDTGRVPYGTRGRETIRRYAAQDMAFLLSRDVKAVLAACGTVSSTAGDIGRSLPIPYFDVIGPAAAAAAGKSENRKIGVIGTSASIRSDAYRQALLGIDYKLEVYSQPCPLFVPLVENAFVSPQEEVTRLVAERYLGPVREAGVDTLIMGCTHYPIISAIIGSVMGREVALIDAGKEAAKALARQLAQDGLLCGESAARETAFYITDDPEGFTGVAELFLGHSVQGRTEQIDIENN